MNIKSVCGAIDPRSALCGAFLLSVLVACLNSLAACVAAFVICLFFVILAAPEASIFFSRLLAANAFILLVWVTVSWSTPGTVIWQWGFLKITAEGTRLAALVTLKANAIFFLFMALIFPMSVSRLGGAMRKLGFPAKLIWILLLMGRNIQVLREEWRAMSEATRLRRFKLGNNWRTYRTIAALLAIFLVRARDRAEKTREAMLLRAYSGALPETANFAFSRADVFFSLLLGFVGATLLGIETGFFNDHI
ncbi:MAG: cobalt ECF transporter T component CbiQ [Desulfovibrio sp.]|nr:cobalt ECF transporter T component CbiQ [Desulfovibrio sp.]